MAYNILKYKMNFKWGVCKPSKERVQTIESLDFECEISKSLTLSVKYRKA